MKALLPTLVIFCFYINYAQKLPSDALDNNVVLIFNPEANVDNNEDTLNFFSEKIIENGFNLVGKYMFTDSEISQKEIEFDIKNKDVKYVFLLTYKYYKGADYDLYFYESDMAVNPDIIEPNKEIFRLKPGFIHTTKDFRGTIAKLLKKEVAKLEEKHDDLNTADYDTDLINTMLLSEENIDYLEDLNNRYTLIDGVTLKVENSSIPTDLKSYKLAVIGTDKIEYRNNKSLNSILKSQMKKYPFEYEFFKDYESYLVDGGSDSYKYRLQLSKSNESMLSMGNPKYSSTESYKKNTENINVKPTMRTTPINYRKDLFSVILKDNSTGERYLVSNRNFLGQSLKNFISKL